MKRVSFRPNDANKSSTCDNHAIEKFLIAGFEEGVIDNMSLRLANFQAF